jgi:signal peptidase II
LPDGGWLAAIGRRPWLGLVVAVIVVALDQWTKHIATSELDYRVPVMVTSWFDWMLTYNTGAAFSFLADAGGWQRWFLTGIAAAVSVFIVVWLFRLNPADRGLVLPLGLILGGGMGNLIDRVLLGHVVDFISLHYEHRYWPAFNLADSAITLGAAWWLVDAFWCRTSPSKEAPVS